MSLLVSLLIQLLLRLSNRLVHLGNEDVFAAILPKIRKASRVAYDT